LPAQRARRTTYRNAWAAANGNLAGTRAGGERPHAGDARQNRRVGRFRVRQQPPYSGVIGATPLIFSGCVQGRSLRGS
jgi:hypothetical protein